MGRLEAPMRSELQILFHALCDGLRQEVRQRNLANLVTGRDFSLVSEREVGVASSLAGHLRLIGFNTQVASYFAKGSAKRTPDFRIWLPASRKYIYLELKIVGWGNCPYYYQGAINDIGKLNSETDPRNKQNGLIALGFSRNPEKRQGQLLKGFEKSLSQKITKDYPHYEEIGRECIDLEGMDKETSYAVIGLWFRKSGKIVKLVKV